MWTDDSFVGLNYIRHFRADSAEPKGRPANESSKQQQLAPLKADGMQGHPGAREHLALAPFSVTVDEVVDFVPDSGIFDLVNPPLVLGAFERMEFRVVHHSLARNASWGSAERFTRTLFVRARWPALHAAS